MVSSFARSVTRAIDRVILCRGTTVDTLFAVAMSLGERERQEIVVVFQDPAGTDGKQI